MGHTTANLLSSCARATLPVLLLSTLLVAGACGGGGGGRSYSDRLIVVRNEGLAELSLAGGDETLLVAKPEDAALIEPALSPGGDRLAFVRQLTPLVIPGEPVELGMDLYLANADGSSPVLLLEHSRSNESVRSPAWFPDGGRLLINVQNLEGAQVVSQIEVLDVGTGARTTVVDDAFSPAVSADGTRIAFVRQDEQLNQSLWVAVADGSGEQQIAGPPDGLGGVSSPRFSPDGRYVAFGAAAMAAGSVRGAAPVYVSRAGAGVANGAPQDVWIYDLESNELRMLAELTLDQPGVAWSGDGTTIFVFAGAGLFAVDPGDGSSRRLADGTFHGQVTWVAPE